jgi:arginine:pyruvate transaminase
MENRDMRYASITTRLQGLGGDKWAVHIKARRLFDGGHPIIMLTIGEPDIPVSGDLMDVLEASMRAGRTRYSDGRGEPQLLKALAQKYTIRTGRVVTEKNICCLPGTQTALYAVMMALVEAGDEVLVGDPLYATYDGIIGATGASRVSVPLDAANGFHLKAADVEKAITPRTKVLLLNSPHNPTGAVLSVQEIAEIAEVCERHDLWIVSDEVYEDLIFDSQFASPFDVERFAKRTVAVSSISKSHAAPGFRSGWCAGPEEFCQLLLPISESMLFGGQPFIADMTAHAIASEPLAAMTMRTAFKRRLEIVLEHLGQEDALICHRPQAGMFVLIDVKRTGLSGEAFALRLLDECQVAVMPGEAFGMQTNGFIRISLTVPDDAIREACGRISGFIGRINA